jgi:hypothetical protein
MGMHIFKDGYNEKGLVSDDLIKQSEELLCRLSKLERNNGIIDSSPGIWVYHDFVHLLSRLNNRIKYYESLTVSPKNSGGTDLHY